MKVLDLIVENKEKTTTGRRSIDSIVGHFSSFSPSEEFFQSSKNSLPVPVSEPTWQTLDYPERISKIFLFSSLEKKKYFVNEIMSYQEKSNHHASIIISGDEVKIETYTHTVNSVTNQDLKLARFADEVYEDTRYFTRR